MPDNVATGVGRSKGPGPFLVENPGRPELTTVLIALSMGGRHWERGPIPQSRIALPV